MSTETDEFIETEEQLGDFEVHDEYEPAPAYAEATPQPQFDSGPSEEAAPIDPVAHHLTEYIGGTRPEDWELRYSGEGYVFDGKEIFNPQTGESYWGTVERSPEHELVHQEMVQKWNEAMQENQDKDHIFQLPDHKETTPDGERLSVTVLILGPDKNVRYEIREIFVPRKAEEIEPREHEVSHDQETRGRFVEHPEPATEHMNDTLSAEAAAIAYARAAESTGGANGTSETLHTDVSRVEAAGVMHASGIDMSDGILHTSVDEPSRESVAAPVSVTQEHTTLSDVRTQFSEQWHPVPEHVNEPRHKATEIESGRHSENLERTSIDPYQRERTESPVTQLLHEANLFAVIGTPDETLAVDIAATRESLREEPIDATSVESIAPTTSEAAGILTSEIHELAQPAHNDSIVHIASLEQFLKEELLTLSDMQSEPLERDARPHGPKDMIESAPTPDTAAPSVRETPEKPARADARESGPPLRQVLRDREPRVERPRIVAAAEQPVSPFLQRRYAEALSKLRTSPPPNTDSDPTRAERTHKLNGITLRRAA
ncbi:MAG: hypothetical protein AAB480_03140 [Patescibacteria group bacterium]